MYTFSNNLIKWYCLSVAVSFWFVCQQVGKVPKACAFGRFYWPAIKWPVTVIILVVFLSYQVSLQASDDWYGFVLVLTWGHGVLVAIDGHVTYARHAVHNFVYSCHPLHQHLFATLSPPSTIFTIAWTNNQWDRSVATVPDDGAGAGDQRMLMLTVL